MSTTNLLGLGKNACLKLTQVQQELALNGKTDEARDLYSTIDKLQKELREANESRVKDLVEISEKFVSKLEKTNSSLEREIEIAKSDYKMLRDICDKIASLIKATINLAEIAAK